MGGIDNKILYDFLSSSHIVEKTALKQAFDQAEQTATPLERVLVVKDLVGDAALGNIIADLLQLPFVQLSQVSIPDDVLHILPEPFARNHRLIAFSQTDRALNVAAAFPTHQESAIGMISKKTGLPVVIHYATESDINNAFSFYLDDLFAMLKTLLKNASESYTPQESSIIHIVDLLLQYAYRSKASDIHIEPSQTDALVRFRIDGVLHDVLSVNPELYSLILTRVKVMSGLRIDEHQEPQDGALRYSFGQDQMDVRTSIVPTTRGEDIVLRLLSEKWRQFALSDLGLSPDNLDKLENAYRKSRGMIIASGPAGSGKTTTMYAILRLLNKPDVGIMTIEDPVEYQIEHVRQIQVNTNTGLSFAKGLRSIIRQDPNIILVGEIRDNETADIAINASLTGHLVLSTLHTNDAATAMPRLIDMGIEPYLIASSINAIVAQRLVRSICRNCRATYTPNTEEKKLIKETFDHASATLQVYKGKGCSVCLQTGYKGRTGLFEVLEVDDEVKEAITSKKDASTIRSIAIKNGMVTIQDDGLEKIKQGITTIEEVLGVTKEVQ